MSDIPHMKLNAKDDASLWVSDNVLSKQYKKKLERGEKVAR